MMLVKMMSLAMKTRNKETLLRSYRQWARRIFCSSLLASVSSSTITTTTIMTTMAPNVNRHTGVEPLDISPSLPAYNGNDDDDDDTMEWPDHPHPRRRHSLPLPQRGSGGPYTPPPFKVFLLLKSSRNVATTDLMDIEDSITPETSTFSLDYEVPDSSDDISPLSTDCEENQRVNKTVERRSIAAGVGKRGCIESN